jgi:outer membrane receptor protein involved in Fe transport
MLHLHAVTLLTLLCAALQAAAQSPETPDTPSTPAGPVAPAAGTQRVEVIGTSPLPGQGIDRNLLPYSTQLVRRSAIDEAQPENLTDYMARRMPGMQVNDIQGSPLQSDLSFRGYRASGLLGAAQGLSVYLDGVRMNEPFGDVVNWDMLPEFALESIALVPGANPAFGLNTLGGAISFTTTSGVLQPGVSVEASIGSFGRRQLEASYGHADDDSGWHQFIGGSTFEETGWRDFSAGRVSQVFAKIGHRSPARNWALSALGGRSRLVGNGLLPAYTLDVTDEGVQRRPDLYASRRNSVFTHPDITRNELGLLSLQMDQALAGGARLDLLAYARDARRDTVNGDGAEDDDDDGGDDGGGDDNSAPNAAFNATATRQRSWGLAADVSGTGGGHQWQAGITFDASRIGFDQTEQPGFFDDTRGVIPAAVAPRPSVAVDGDARAWGVYASDTWSIGAATHLTATVRYNRAQVANTLQTANDDNDDAPGLVAQPRERFTYGTLNPAIGLTQRLSGGWSVYGNIARNTRIPTVIELGCADPEEPCRLPAGLQSDPYLKPVRSTNVEIGMRWRPDAAHSIELSAYRIDNRDDILFRSVSATSQLGYFQNFPRTRNQGMDAQWQGRFGALAMQAAYSLLDATYEAADTLRIGQRNVAITPGTRQAGLPRHSFKLGADWRASPAFSVGGDVQVLSRRVLQGNEDGLIDDSGTRADLSLPGYALLHLRAAWRVRSGIELLLRVSNVFDRRYETYGALAETVFDANGVLTGDERDAVFVAPGAPRSVFAGLRARF